MNYDGMQADIVEMFVEAGRRRHTHVKGLFESRDVDGGGDRWRRDADTGRLWRPASGQERAEQGKAFRALLRAGGAAVTLERCPHCGGIVERREGRSGVQHVRVIGGHCPSRVAGAG